MNRRDFCKLSMKTFAISLACKTLGINSSIAQVSNQDERKQRMKVLLLNGSPHEKGCTYTALQEIADQLQKEGISSEIFWVGNQPIMPCLACGGCAKQKKCVINDKVNEFLEKAADFDGYIFGSPVHYASASGNIVPFLHRVFMTEASSGKNIFRLKPSAAITTARRAGTTATIDQLNKYFQVTEMPIISGRYWTMVHGNNPDEIRQDKEGMQNMRILAKNMAYFLKCQQVAKKAGIEPPMTETAIWTNFIR